jgi:hypothetical protein
MTFALMDLTHKAHGWAFVQAPAILHPLGPMQRLTDIRYMEPFRAVIAMLKTDSMIPTDPFHATFVLFLCGCLCTWWMRGGYDAVVDRMLGCYLPLLLLSFLCLTGADEFLYMVFFFPWLLIMAANVIESMTEWKEPIRLAVIADLLFKAGTMAINLRK